MKRATLLLMLIFASAWSAHSGAHEMTLAELELRENTRGEFLWAWLATEQPARGELFVQWPDGCRADETAVHCGRQGMLGTLTVEGIGQSFSVAIVRINWLDGRVSVHSLTAAQSQVQLFGSADDQRGMGEIARAYAELGVEHILSGYDHLAFVMVLVLLVGFNRRLLLTVTGFTVAHSLTLALSALGWLTLRSAPVEANIALSIVLVAREAMHEEMTLAKRWPVVIAVLFGLVHGLGFAGALKEIGLPQQHLAIALLMFNFGVELGQLLVLAVAFATWRLLLRRFQLGTARVIALYSIGTLAAWWSIERVAAMLE